MGSLVFRNLLNSGFACLALTINPGYKKVPDKPADDSLEQIGKPVELAVIADAWQRGIAHRLMEQLIAAARLRDLGLMEGTVLANNTEMLNLASKLDFSVQGDPDDPTLRQITKLL